MIDPRLLRAALAVGLLAFLVRPAVAQEAPASAPTAEDESFARPAERLPEWGQNGLFEVRDPFLIALSRSSPWATSPQVLEHLEVEVGLRTVWANSWSFSANRVVIDAETREFILDLKLGLFDRLELALHLPYQWRGGGVLDGFLEGFHDLFGLPDGRRDSRPRDRFQNAGLQSNGQTFELRHPGYGFGDLIVGARGQLTQGGPLSPALTATLRLRLPTGRPKFDLSDGVDATVQLDASKRLGKLPLVLSAGVAYTYYAETSVGGLRLLRHRLFGYVGAEWEIDQRWSFVVHAWMESRRETKLWKNNTAVLPKARTPFGNYVTYIAAGFKFRVGPATVELGLLENIIDPDVTADIGFLFNLRVRL